MVEIGTAGHRFATSAQRDATVSGARLPHGVHIHPTASHPARQMCHGTRCIATCSSCLFGWVKAERGYRLALALFFTREQSGLPKPNSDGAAASMPDASVQAQCALRSLKLGLRQQPLLPPLHCAGEVRHQLGAGCGGAQSSRYRRRASEDIWLAVASACWHCSRLRLPKCRSNVASDVVLLDTAHAPPM